MFEHDLLPRLLLRPHHHLLQFRLRRNGKLKSIVESEYFMVIKLDRPNNYSGAVEAAAESNTRNLTLISIWTAAVAGAVNLRYVQASGLSVPQGGVILYHSTTPTSCRKPSITTAKLLSVRFQAKLGMVLPKIGPSSTCHREPLECAWMESAVPLKKSPGKNTTASGVQHLLAQTTNMPLTMAIRLNKGRRTCGRRSPRIWSFAKPSTPWGTPARRRMTSTT